MEELMLKIENVSKLYKLGQIGGTTLREELQRLIAKKRGREDPTKKIGERDYEKGETFMALNAVSFSVKKGERLGIIGHNGAGKSTLLKLISRITAPTGGSIYLNGRVASMLEVGTGFHGELTGRENIYMNGAILGMTKKEIDAKIEDIIEFSECRQFIDTPVKRYSSGMYVKLAFSVAAHLNSEIMIMDEVLAVGDMAFQKKCIEKMSAVSKAEERTILYVSHNMNTIRQLCDRVVVLDHGKVVFDGDTKEGIGVYMGVRPDERTFFEFMHETKDSARITMKDLQILGRDSNRVQHMEPLQFLLRCSAKGRIDQIWFRLEIFNSEGTVIGTCFSDQPIQTEHSGEFKVEMSLSTNNLTPGRYTCSALLYDRTQFGNQNWIDRVYPALSFEIIPDETRDLNWNHRFWGHVQFDDIKIINVS